jgi:type IV secretory pathway protease TraF
MTFPLDTGNRWAMVGVTSVLLAFGASVADHAPALALVNESPSLARGLYVRASSQAIRRGVVVATPQPAAGRTYLAALGMPADVLLIKRVAAVEGDRVCRGPGRLVTPTRTVEVHDRDRRGANLPVWIDCRRLETGEVFLLGDTASSFDSRYFGPVRREALTGVYKEALTW